MSEIPQFNNITLKFMPGDYIINRTSGDMGLIDKIEKRGYYRFKYYYGHMFHHLYEPGHTLQINYQTFYEKCTEEEKYNLMNFVENGVIPPDPYIERYVPKKKSGKGTKKRKSK